jgi:hypothetical protein
MASAVVDTQYTTNLEVAAKIALQGIQVDLLDHLARGALEVEPRLAKELITDRSRAITALIELYGDTNRAKGDKLAKETLLELTGGEPLTICMGDPQRIGGIVPKYVQTDAGEFQYTAKGCRAVMPDSIQTDRPMWPALCIRCQKAWRAEERRVKTMVANMDKSATVYESAAFSVRADGHLAASRELETSCPTPWIVESARAKGLTPS